MRSAGLPHANEMENFNMNPRFRNGTIASKISPFSPLKSILYEKFKKLKNLTKLPMFFDNL